MALKISVEYAVSLIGHDGGEIIFPELQEPICRRGFHTQELIELAMSFGESPTPFQMFPSTRSECGQYEYTLHTGSQCDKRRELFSKLIHRTQGVLEGRGHVCHHAVAYDTGKILDPDGREYPYSIENCEAQGFYGKQLWIFN